MCFVVKGILPVSTHASRSNNTSPQAVINVFAGNSSSGGERPWVSLSLSAQELPTPAQPPGFNANALAPFYFVFIFSYISIQTTIGVRACVRVVCGRTLVSPSPLYRSVLSTRTRPTSPHPSPRTLAPFFLPVGARW